VTAVLLRLGNTLAPIALVSVGYQLRLSAVRGRVAPLGAALLYKLAIGPAIVFLVLTGVLGLRGTVIQVTIFEAAMAPQIGAAIVAMDNDLDPSLATLLIGIGIPLSFLTLPVWFQVLQRV
jgi:predicted permease